MANIFRNDCEEPILTNGVGLLRKQTTRTEKIKERLHRQFTTRGLITSQQTVEKKIKTTGLKGNLIARRQGAARGLILFPQ